MGSMFTTPSSGTLVIRPDTLFTSVKVFSATMFADRAQLGEKITRWLGENPQAELTEVTVTQSSDASFHCIAITLFYREMKRAQA